MTFLNPIFPWALLALAIPLLIHLFNFRRPKKILFSNISLVKEVQRTVVRKLKLKQWLVLAARTLAVLCLLFVFANPVIPGKDSADGKAGKHAIAIVLDDSYSMGTGNENGAYFLQGKKLAAEILKGFPRDNEFLVMPLSALKLNYNFGSPEDARSELDSYKPRENLNGLPDILGLSQQIFSKAKFTQHSLFFLSDFQYSTQLPDSIAYPKEDKNLSITLLPLANRGQKNVYITSHEIETRIVEPGKPITLKLKLINDSPDPVTGQGIRVSLEGKAIAISTEDLEGGAAKEVSVSFTPPGTGWQSGFIELDDYPVEFDNRRYFSFYVPEREKILIVEEEGTKPVRLIYEQLLTQFSPEFISFKNFSSAKLEDFKFIALVGVNDISSGMAEQLKSYLDDGHSVIYFPGTAIQRENVNAFLTSVKAATLGDLVTVEKGIAASNPDLQHPVFADVFKKSRKVAQFDPPMVYKYYRLQPDNTAIQNRVIALSNTDLLLLESKGENGTLFTFSILPDNKWTDLHFKAIFPPLMLRLSLMMNQTQAVQQSQELGNFTLKKVKSRDKELIHLLTRDGQDLIPEQFSESGFINLNFNPLTDLREGNYELNQKEKVLEKISFNIPDKESLLKSASEKELREYVTAKNLPFVNVSGTTSADIAGELRAKVEGIPLWKYFLIGGILFLFAEILLLRMKETR